MTPKKPAETSRFGNFHLDFQIFYDTISKGVPVFVPRETHHRGLLYGPSGGDGQKISGFVRWPFPDCRGSIQFFLTGFVIIFFVLVVLQGKHERWSFP